MMGKGAGFAKAILFGEHFVVQGAHALGASLSKEIRVKISPAEKLSLNIETGTIVPEASRAILSSFSLPANYRIEVEADIPSGAGLGWSAAYSVALSRAAAEEKGISPGWREIARHAYEGEKVFHGNPSGIDNTLSSQRGVVLFRRNEEPLSVELAEPLRVVVADSGKTGPTKELVAGVSLLKDEKPQYFSDLMEREEELVMDAKRALEQGNIPLLGRLMNRNQEYLRQIGVSSPELEGLIEVFRDEGALGAKLTGAGGGGCAIALLKSKKDASAILQRIDKNHLIFEAQIG
ncbi:mevalonate kinase [Candidatus Micrarchaeota archaeon]|nr:mevalonate kinase [Candidatus Micrarchaeota archaeon]